MMRPRCNTVIVSADLRDHLHVVLHHQDRAARRTRLDQRRDPIDVFVAHALRRLVQQHQFRAPWQAWWRFPARACARRPARPRSCRRRRRAPPPPAVPCARIEACRASARSPELEVTPRARCNAMRTFSNTLRCGKTADIWNERTMPRRATSAGRAARDVFALVKNLAARRDQELREQVEAGGLAGAVGTDEGVDLARANAQIQVTHGGEAVELPAQAVRLQKIVERHVPRAGGLKQSHIHAGHDTVQRAAHGNSLLDLLDEP